MGYPEQHYRSTNASGVFVILALVVGLGLLLIGGLFLFGFSFYQVRSASPMPATPVESVKVVSTDGGTLVAIVEIDQSGQTRLNGEAMPVEQIEAKLREEMQRNHLSSNNAYVHVVEGAPYEPMDKVLAMYRNLGIENPQMTTIPPERDVVVELDAEGKATIDGAAVEDAHAALQEIASKYGSRAKVTIRAHPQCPADAVVQITASCRQLGFGKINIGAAPQAEATE